MKTTLEHYRLPFILMFFWGLGGFSQDYDWQWAKRGGGSQNAGHPNSWGSGLEQILDVKVDKDNNYYYVGVVNGNTPQFMGHDITHYGSADVYIVSTDCEGNFRWHTTLGGSIGESFAAIALDTLGGVYISFSALNTARPNNDNIPPHYAPGVSLGYGDSNGPNPNNRRIVLIKYDTEGNYLWHTMPQDENVTSSPIEGYFHGGAAAYSITAEPDGTLHWLCGFREGNHLGGQLVVEPEDLPELEGSILGTYSTILKYDKDGNYLGHIPVPLNRATGTLLTKMYHDRQLGRYYITLYSTSGGNPSSNPVWNGENLPIFGAVFALDNQGNELWRKLSPANSGASVISLAIDSESNVYLTGKAAGIHLGGELAGHVFVHNFTSPYLIKLDSDGNLLWGTGIDSSDNPYHDGCPWNCRGRDVTVNGDEVAIAGQVVAVGTGNFGPGWQWGNLSWSRPPGHGNEPIVIRFNKETGEPLAYHDIYGPPQTQTTEELMTIATDLNGNYITGGYARGTIFLNHDTVEPLHPLGGDSDFFIAKLGNSPCAPPMSVGEPAKEKIKLYPNPTGGMLYIEAENLQSYAVYNLVGRQVLRGGFENGNVYSVNLESLSTGTYLVRFTLSDGGVVTEKVVRL